MLAHLLWIKAEAQKQIEELKPALNVFIGPDCPISINYLPTLKSIGSTYGDKLEMKFYCPRGFTTDEVQSLVSEYELDFDITVDEDGQFAKKFGAKFTPEVFLTMNNRVVYSGAIDNWYFELGKKRLKPSHHYLVTAIEALLRDGLPEIIRTRPIGCPIN